MTTMSAEAPHADSTEPQSATNVGQRVTRRITPELCGNRLGRRAVNQLCRDFAGITIEAGDLALEDTLGSHPLFPSADHGSSSW